MDTEARSAITRKLAPSRFYDSYFLTEYGRIEASRANRYNTSFSIVLIDIDGYGGSSLFEHAQGIEFLKKLATAVIDTTRTCDVAGLSDTHRMMVILPETDHFGALATIKKLSRSLGALKKPDAPVGAVFAHATFPRDGKDFGEVVGAALKRSFERKESLWEKEGLKHRLFWEIIGNLTSKGYTGPDAASFDAGAGQELSEFFLDQINELMVREIARSPEKRGIMYYGAKSISASLPVVKTLGSAGAVSTKVFLVGEGEGSVWEVKNALPLLLDDPRLRETFFTFFLNEDTAYALVCKENWGATFSCFHTSDNGLVEGLISKFQQEYSLQEQLG
ncbi:MAG TPA: diguanylate cyclase [Thermodesulfobacteriota bacterium]